MFADAIRRISFLRCVIFLCLLLLIFSSLSPHFLSGSNLENIVAASSVIGLLALAETFVIASGGVDLSVASVMALAGTVCAFLIQNTDASPSFAILICCAVGGACGLTTGLLINLTRAPSFIISLGMLSVGRALAYIVADGTPIYGLPERITGVIQGQLLGVSGPLLFMIGAGALTYVWLHHTRFGLHALILGDNQFAAEATGVPLDRLRLQIYSCAGALAGLAGFVFMARTNCGDPTAGQNYELVAITAVVLGGAKLYGGRATIAGTLLGIACLGVLQNGLNLLAVSTYYQVLFIGLVLIAAASLERLGTGRER